MDPQVIVNFTCQRCHQPVHLDTGFSHLSEITLAELSLPIHTGSEVEFGGRKLDKIVNPFRFYDTNVQAHGFTIVGDPSENQKLPPLKLATKLFDLLSSNSDIDHPMCEECTDNMLEAIDSYIARTEKQVLLYDKLYSSRPDLVRDDNNELEEEARILKEEKTRLLTELAEVESEQEIAELALKKCKEEKERLEDEETNYWREYCAYKCQVIAMEDENRSLKGRMSYMQYQMDRLRQTNVFNATFHIWHSGHFGTINNLRLGRLPSVPVTWPEINAAWGQTVLLLWALARKIGLTFSKYNLVPHGNTSYIEVIGENKDLPLYGSGGIRFLWDHKFDQGMAAFLECLSEFKQHIESSGFQESKDVRKKFNLPYKVNKHQMEDAAGCHYSIKMQFNSEEHWTKALKFLLINLKWALTWVSSPKVTIVSSETSSPSH